MQNSIQKFRQISTVFGKPGVLSKRLKTLTSSNYPTAQYLFAETLHTFSSYQCLEKDVWDFFYFIYFLSYLQIKKDLVSTHLFFTLLLIIQDLNKIK